MPSVFYLRNRKIRSAARASQPGKMMVASTAAAAKVSRRAACVSKKRRKRRNKLRNATSGDSAPSSLRKGEAGEVCLDPVMLEPVGPDPYEHTRIGREPVLFNVETLIAYMLHSGSFVDPVTRIPFTDEELRAVDAFAIRRGLALRSVLAAKNDKQEQDALKFRRDAILGLERCAGGYITATLQLVEGDPDFMDFEDYYSDEELHIHNEEEEEDSEDSEDGEEEEEGGDSNGHNIGGSGSSSSAAATAAVAGRASARSTFSIVSSGQIAELQKDFLTKILPEFSDLYRQLRAADADYARQCMSQWEAFLRGPPNRPSKDKFRLLEDFIRQLKTSF